MSETYDSRKDTIKHQDRVRDLLDDVMNCLSDRGAGHDATKLQSPEKETFDIVTPQLKGSTYGSEEYKGFLAAMKPALDHHYANNRHHPEHHPNGVRDMSLLDLLEMLCDWKAAGERHANGSIEASLKHNRKRFNISDEMFAVLESTVKEMGWME